MAEHWSCQYPNARRVPWGVWCEWCCGGDAFCVNASSASDGRSWPGRDKRIDYKCESIRVLNNKMKGDPVYAFYLDNSGSTSGSPHYWQTVSEILTVYSKSINHYFFWNSSLQPTSLPQILKAVGKRNGMGGTNPELVANAIVHHGHTNLILVTDGEVGSVEGCDRILQLNANKFRLNKVICFIVASGGSELNMSVTCPFTRNCESEVFKKLKSSAMTKMADFKPADFDLLTTIQDMGYEAFELNYEKLEAMIIAVNMGRESNIPLKDRLVCLKKRILKELTNRVESSSLYDQTMREALEHGDVKEALSIAGKMTHEYFNKSEGLTIDKKINHLINLCGDLRGRFDPNEIKSNKMATAEDAQFAQIDNSLDTHELTDHKIECPIIMDEDVPQILIDECQPLFLGLEKEMIDDISACPLRILNYPEVRKRFRLALSNFTGVKFADAFLKNPFTQNRLLGAIPLGSHPNHVLVGNHTIAKLLTGGKILGNMNLYFAAIWSIIMNDEIQYLVDVKKNVNEHMLYRLRNSRTTSSLCGLPQYTSVRLSTDMAVWYSVNSCALNQPTARDTFRFHLYNIRPMVQILVAFGYPCHPNLEPHYFRTLATFKLLTKLKKMTHPQRKAFMNLFKGLYQNGIFIDTTKVSEEFMKNEICPAFIPIDGPASPLQVAQILQMLPRECRVLSPEDLYHISTQVHADKSAADIFLDFNWNAPALPAHEVNWCYGLNPLNPKVEINPKTMRPAYRVQGDVWSECAKKTFKVDNTQVLFKGMKYAEGYIIKHRKQPLYEELLAFYYNRYIETGKKTTLPFLTDTWTKEIVEDYRPFFPFGYNIDHIVHHLNASRTIANRVLMEK